MQTRPLPETPEGRSPAGAEIRYLMGGTTGDMIHSTVPPEQVNRATVHATVSEFWYVLSGPGGNLAPGRERGRSDRSDAGCLHRHPGRYCLPVPLYGGGSAAVSVHHDAALAGRRGGNPPRRSVGADSASRPGVFRHCALRQTSVAGSEPAVAQPY
jgi:hypothetical protein